MNELEAKTLFWQVNDILKEIGLKYSLYFGTLLGAIRENGFIKIDRDLDLYCLAEDFEEKKDELLRLLKQDGLIVILKTYQDAGLKIKSKERHTVKGCDICCFFKSDKQRFYPKNKSNQKVFHLAEDIENMKEIVFYDRKVLVPENSEKILEEIYGKDWRIPYEKYRYENQLNVAEL